MGLIDKATAWLTPAKRKAIYGVLGVLGTLAVSLGYASDSTVANVIGLVDAALAVVILALASIKAKRLDWTVAYGVLATLVAAIRVIGWIDDGGEGQIIMVLDAVGRLAPFLAFFRTDPATETGEPMSEYVARHVAVNSPDVAPSVVVDTNSAEGPQDPDGSA